MKVTTPPLNLRYVTDPRDWASSPGTDFIWTPSTTTALITGGTAGQPLSEFGSVTNSLLYQTVTSSAANFNSKATPGTPNGLGTDATGDIFHTSPIFGDYNHMRAAGDILGYQPTRMVLEVFASFTVASANEPRSVFGWAKAATADWSLAASSQASIGSDSANFDMRDSTLTNWTGAVVGPAVDNGPHLFQIINDGTNHIYSVDGTQYGILAIQTGTYPVSFYWHTLTTNRLFVHNIHIYYR